MVEQFANSGDPDQTPHSATSDLGLHCLPVTLLGVSRLQWVNHKRYKGTKNRLNGDLKPDHKKTADTTTMDPTTDNDNQASIF